MKDSKTFEYFKESADYVKEIIGEKPDCALILGSCLGGFSARIQNKIEIDYEDIPNFLTSTVSSHAGKLIFGTVAGKKILCMSGRFHFYEGYDFEQLTVPIRLFKLLGAEYTIITNASGAVNTSYKPGDIMIIKDHIKLNGASPLRGKNTEEFGHRFFDVTDMYTSSLRKKALKCAENTDLNVHEGIYMYFTGPQFETPAEIRAARILGADAVGMSTVTEALTAAHCSMPLLAAAVITNMAAGVTSNKLSFDEVDVTADAIADKFGDYIEKIISEV